MENPILAHRKWPPSDLSELVLSETGIIDMALKPSVKPKQNRALESDVRYGLLKKLYAGTAIKTDSLRNIALLDRAVRISGAKPDFDLYPMIMDIRNAVAAVKSGEPVEQAPINDPKILVITSPKTVCREKGVRRGELLYPLDLVVFIKSCALCFEDRKRARQTFVRPQMWGGFRVRFTFVVGLPNIHTSSVVTINGVKIEYRHARINDTSELKYAREVLFRESNQHGDLLIGGFLDSYYNLTLKLTLTFRWASVFCLNQTPIFLFMDDDFDIIPVNMVRFVQKLSLDEKLLLIGGLSNIAKGPHRPSDDPRENKWAVSWDDYPWETYPGYLFGGAYMVGSSRVVDAAIAMAFTRPFHIDDTFLGLVWTKLHYFSLIIPGFVQTVHPGYKINETIVALHSSVRKYVDWNSSANWALVSSF
ncbi:unnamed protein product [Calicophoron daubneyi]|uniref:Hexosyltransferase n=1 Tax=Calicophoron daubneyi TaxID=300641 RepID=A0AAV2TGX7_CALDB